MKKIIATFPTILCLIFSHYSQSQSTNILDDDNNPVEETTEETADNQLQSNTFNNIKSFSVGVKIGIPNTVSIGVQYTLPILNNHFAPYVDYSKIDLNMDEVGVGLKFTEFGISYYFNNKGKGLYAGLGFSNLEIKGEYDDIELDNGRIGIGIGAVSLNTTNLKLGIKTGGTIYFRIEVGYGFGELPQTVKFEATDKGSTSYKEEVIEDIPDLPGITDSGMLVANFGFGISL